MKKFAILGSGFGLYGYLPALALSGFKIILPRRYQTRWIARVELACFATQIEWQPDEQSAIAAASGVVLSLPPEQQSLWIPICLNKKNIRHLLLEKPLAKSPKEAYNLLEQLEKTNKKCRVGYLFRYTAWGCSLLKQLKNEPIAEISINWHFMAHHYQNNVQTWKRTHSAGGSVLRFYGIHLLALLAELGYEQVSSSCLTGKITDEYDHWQGTFTGPGLPPCNICIDTRANQSLFHIEQTILAKTTNFIKLSDPFQNEAQLNALDGRAFLLKELCASLFSSNDTMPDYYYSTIDLWQQAENLAIQKETFYD